ncbi:MAG: hypothetical protein DMD83_15940 [Candidatus Rokuibacteriota bacterium]|nr:MAG: hypothetical protein DMD83_15940 [Candidatus Rokubacteria bacterium]
MTARRGEELVGCLGVVDGARQHQGADETRQDGHRPAAARDAAPIRHVLGEESQPGLEARGQGPPRGGRLARQLGPEWHERATSLGTEVAQPCGLEGWRGS